MKRFLFAILILTILEALTSRCANPKTPTGGPKDTIPPSLISSNPKSQSINFKDQTFELTFDERVNADKLKSNLIITPTTEITYKTLIKKNVLTIQLDEPLDDSTTYTFNFFDGVTDITERNPAENLVIAFSTGSFIDSISISGSVYDINNAKQLSGITIGLYQNTDTLDFKEVKPNYFITSNDEGTFQIQNIKSNQYRLLAFKDENKNLLFDPTTEEHGFITDLMTIDSSNIDSLRIPILKLDVSEFKLLSGRPSAHYFDIRYSKVIQDYNITSETNLPVYTELTPDRDAIRVYKNNMLSDSTQLIIQATDTLSVVQIDTLYAKYRESSKKLNPLGITLSSTTVNNYFEDSQFTLSLTKPIQNIVDSSFLFCFVDSLITFDLPVINLQSNANQSRFTFNSTISTTQLQDSIALYLNTHPIDTTDIDTAQLIINKRLERYNTSAFNLIVKPGSFISVESDTSEQTQSIFKFPNPENFGTVTVSITDPLPSYTVQLMAGDKIKKQLTNCTNCIFDFTPPGNYWTRVLIDENQDSIWSPGNINLNVAPEPVLHFLEETTLRANWEVELEYSLLTTD
ncbi:MAG: Ig-like domain-containing protein [Cyclobacteriaceae bacterium]